MSIGVGEACRLLGVSRDQLKDWSYLFRGYLSPCANPEKGTPRRFTPEDIHLLGFITLHWFDDRDFEDVRRGLDCEDHLEDERLWSLRTSVTPLFQDLPPEIDETWYWGAMVGGMGNGVTGFYDLAESYKKAGDLLVAEAIEDPDRYALHSPILFCYRHALELYLKANVRRPKQSHDLPALLGACEHRLKEEFGETFPEWFKRLIISFDDFDVDSASFRYPERGIISRRTGDEGEFWLDLRHVRELMGWASESFRRIHQARWAG